MGVRRQLHSGQRLVTEPVTPPPKDARHGRLRAKMVAWFLIPAALISTGVAVLTLDAYRRVTQELVLERSHDRALLLASQLNATLSTYAQPLGALEGAGQLAQSTLESSSLSARRVFDGGVLVLDSAGQIVAAVPVQADILGQYRPDRLQGIPEPRYSNVIADLLPDFEVIALSWPITSLEHQGPGSIVGLFRVERGATRTSALYQGIWGLYIGRREVAYVVDGNGRIIFHPDTFLIGDDLAAQQVVQRALRGESGAVRALNRDGQPVVVGYAPVPGTPWGLVVEERWDRLIQVRQPYTRLILVLLALGVLVPVAVAALGARRITVPLMRLAQAAQHIAAGHLEQTIEVRTGDELEALAGQFNAMAAQLHASYAVLEQRVADRTRELAILNRITAVVSRSLDLTEVLEAALAGTLEALGMEAGAAFRLGDGDALVLSAHKGLSDSFVQQVSRLPLSESLAARAVQEQAPSTRPVEAYPDGPVKRLLELEGLRLVVSVPLIAKGTVLGVLNLATPQPRALTSEELALLAAIGQQAGVALENARLYEQAEATAAEGERIRLARELHDAVSQTLFSASLIADVLPQLWKRDPETAQSRLQTLRQLTRGALAEMRTLLVELRPATLVRADLSELLRQLSEAAAGRAQLEISVHAQPAPGLPADVKVALYRMAQEALNNTIKHAQATRAEVWLLVEPNRTVLTISDDGRGFDPKAIPAGHFGLLGIRERAEAVGAEVTIDSAPGRGTQIAVVWRPNE